MWLECRHDFIHTDPRHRQIEQPGRDGAHADVPMPAILATAPALLVCRYVAIEALAEGDRAPGTALSRSLSGSRPWNSAARSSAAFALAAGAVSPGRCPGPRDTASGMSRFHAASRSLAGPLRRQPFEPAHGQAKLVAESLTRLDRPLDLVP
jgi:hypothetical protein